MKKFLTVIKYLFFPFLMSQATGTITPNAIVPVNHVVKADIKNITRVQAHDGLWMKDTNRK